MGRQHKRVELGQYIVADPEICHGKPTFKGTRIMVWQVLADVADGRSWEFICNTRWGGRIPTAAVTEAVRLAQEALLTLRRFLKHERFNTVAKRMGLVVRAHYNGIHYWQGTWSTLQSVVWPPD